MRVLQLIDSLRPGGAEKMAVNIANALLPHVEGSFLCCTRKEGLLKPTINPAVGYLFLNKKNTLDLEAILKLRNFIRNNEINIVHAHSSSYFLAGLLKLVGCKFKLVWHDHYGESEFLEQREYSVLKRSSFLFNGIISVNTKLQEWALERLNCKKVLEIKNFIPETEPSEITEIKLKGLEGEFKIINVANLRPQKDHLNLIDAFEKLDLKYEVSLHLIGENPADEYAKTVLHRIDASPKKQQIYYYGTKSNIPAFLKKADLGILSSRSEGLPLALLEYGMAGLPVITTNVGQCPEVIGKAGIIVPANNSHKLWAAIVIYIENEEKRQQDSAFFHQHILKNYSEKSVINKVTGFYKKL